MNTAKEQIKGTSGREATTDRGSAEIRELPSIEFWAGKVTFPEGTSAEDAMRSVIDFVTGNPGSRFSGFLTEEKGRVEYQFTRYPRRQFEEPQTLDELHVLLERFARSVGGIGERVDLPQEPNARIVLGLSEGYFEHEKKSLLNNLGNLTPMEARQQASKLLEEAGKSEEAARLAFSEPSVDAAREALNGTQLTIIHTVGEIRAKVPDQVSLQSATILSVYAWESEGQRHVGHYEEPAVVVQSPVEHEAAIVALGDFFHQERIALERRGPDGSTAHMVEYKKGCTSPDTK
jgi:hypothetical protein